MPNFSDRLKQLRQERGLTQDQLAEQTDIPSASIRRLEVTKTSLPRKDRLILLSNFFKVSIDYLIGSTDVREPQKNIIDNKNQQSKLPKDANEYVLRELVNKYKIDLTDPKNKETLEKMIKLVYEEL